MDVFFQSTVAALRDTYGNAFPPSRSCTSVCVCQVRDKLLGGMSDAQKADIARACNRYPCISMSWKVTNEDDLKAGGTARVAVRQHRDQWLVRENP